MDKRISSLDGARAVSICLVIISHLAFGKAIPGSDYLLKFDLGNVGVRVFFVISGFLITTILHREQTKTGTISLKQFYIRRFFRIAPAYYVFLTITAIAGVLGWITIHFRELPIAALYLSNYFEMGWSWGHTWSLAVEEQFYILWPTVLLLLGPSRALTFSIAILFISPLFRFAADAGWWPTNSQYAFECTADAIATGCILALTRDKLWGLRWYHQLLSWKAFLIIPIALFAAKALYRNPAFWDLIKIPLYNICIAVCLDRYMRLPQLALGRVLNFQPIAWIGSLSYSLYLWQQIFVTSHSTLVAILVGVFSCAVASYYFVEKPFLQLRDRLRVFNRTSPKLTLR